MGLSLVVGMVVGFLASTVVTRAAGVVGRRLHVLDVPNARSSHTRATPRIGGIGMAVGAVVTLVLGGALADPRLVTVAVGAIAMGFVGLLDDLRPMRTMTKFAAQLLLAAAVVALLEPALVLDLPGASLLLTSAPAFVLGVIWIVAVCNAVNFMDGIDGLVGSYAVVAGITAALLVWNPAAVVFLGLAAGAAGFLIWNWQPASIFMGDSGSQFVGFIFAAGLLASGDMPIVASVLLLAPLVLDVGVTLFRRAWRRQDLLSAHREHLYQRVAAVHGHRTVAASYALAGAIFGGAALMYQANGDGVKLAIALAAIMAVLLVAWRQHRWIHG